MGKTKFDPDAAFKNIIGVSQSAEQGGGDEKEVSRIEMKAITTGGSVTPQSAMETRSKRVNLVLRPSVYDKAKERCCGMGISLNECIHQLLEAWCEE